MPRMDCQYLGVGTGVSNSGQVGPRMHNVRFDGDTPGTSATCVQGRFVQCPFITMDCGGSACLDRYFGFLSGKIVQLVVVVAVGM